MMVYTIIFLHFIKYCATDTTTTTTSTTSSTSTVAPWQLSDNMGISDKRKMQQLAKELMVESKLKLRQVIGILADHTRYDGYHYGYLIGKIRENYRNMLEIYKTAVNRLPGFNYSLVLPPATRVVRPIHYIHYMQSIHMLERDIDEMVRLLEWIHTGAATLEPSPFPLPGFAPPLMRARADVIKEFRESEIKKKLRSEEKHVKSKIREEHLMRKIGLPSNTSTTKKRFLDRWPVEDTWRLNDYETI